MPEAREQTRLWLAAALSVLVHLLAALSFGGLSGSRSAAPDALAPEEPPLPLGLDRSDATTITWIGFETPTPNQARESTIEQAAQAVGGGRPAPRAVTETLRRAAERAQSQTESALRALERLLDSVEFATSEEPEAETVAAAPAEAAPPNPDRPSPQPEPSPQPGNAEREADAVSIEEPVKIEWGSPIAAKGLEILTRKAGPNYSAHTRVMLSVRRPPAPLIKIVFAKSSDSPSGESRGRVTYVEVLRSSGVADIDRPLVDAIYTWRARGERLEALADGETIAVRLRIIIQ